MSKHFNHPDQYRLALECSTSLPKDLSKFIEKRKHPKLKEFYGTTDLEAKLDSLEYQDLRVFLVDMTFEHPRSQWYNIYACEPFLTTKYEKHLFILIDNLFQYHIKDRYDAKYKAIQFFLKLRQISLKKKKD